MCVFFYANTGITPVPLLPCIESNQLFNSEANKQCVRISHGVLQGAIRSCCCQSPSAR